MWLRTLHTPCLYFCKFDRKDVFFHRGFRLKREGQGCQHPPVKWTEPQSSGRTESPRHSMWRNWGKASSTSLPDCLPSLSPQHKTAQPVFTTPSKSWVATALAPGSLTPFLVGCGYRWLLCEWSFFFFFFWNDEGSRYCPGWTWTHNPPPSTHCVLGSQAHKHLFTISS
jgi:hypothetical protein